MIIGLKTLRAKIIFIISLLFGGILAAFAVFYWMQFLNMSGDIVIMPGWIGLIRILFQTISWTKQDVFWLAVFTTCFSYTFIFGSICLYVDLNTSIDYDNPLLFLLKILLQILGALAIPTTILGMVGLTIMIPMFIMLFQGNELISTVLPVNKAIIETILIVVPLSLLIFDIKRTKYE